MKRTGIRDQGSGNRGQGTGVREQGSGNRDQGTGIREQGSEFIPDDVYALSGFIDGDFQDLICKVRLLVKFFENKPKKKPLKFEVHSRRPVDADEARVELNICEYSFGARCVLRTTEVLAIPSDENPILLKQDFLQFPVFPA
jgi:hypothetical protein